MNRFALGLLLFSSSAFADKTIPIQVNANARCVLFAVFNFGKLTANCSDPDLEKMLLSLPDLTRYNENMDQLARLRDRASTMTKSVRALEQKVQNGFQQTTQDLGKLQDRFNETESELSTLRQQNELLRVQLSEALSGIPALVGQAADTNARVAAQAIYDREFRQFSQSLYYQIDEQLTAYRRDLEKIKGRVDALERDVSFLMHELLEGRLQTHVSFFGLSVGGVDLAHAWRSKIGIDYELLLPEIAKSNMRGSMFIEFAALSWKQTYDYQTLPGLAPISTEDTNDVRYVAIGAKVFIPGWTDKALLLPTQPYVGMAFGHSIGGVESTYYYAFIIGSEYYRRTTRLALELRWDKFSNIQHQEVTFNPFGNASVRTVSEAPSGWYVGVKVLFQ